MKEHTPDAGQSPFEEHSRKLFQESVDAMDMRLRSRLTQARHAALDAAAAAKCGPWLLRMGTWTPAAGVTAVTVSGSTQRPMRVARIGPRIFRAEIERACVACLIPDPGYDQGPCLLCFHWSLRLKLLSASVANPAFVSYRRCYNCPSVPTEP